MLANITKELLLIFVRKYLLAKSRLIQKPANWFATQINSCISIWYELLLNIIPNRLPFLQSRVLQRPKGIDYMFLLCHVRVSEWMYTLYFVKKLLAWNMRDIWYLILSTVPMAIKSEGKTDKSEKEPRNKMGRTDTTNRKDWVKI